MNAIIDISFKHGLSSWHALGDVYEVNVDGLACFIVAGVITWHWKLLYITDYVYMDSNLIIYLVLNKSILQLRFFIPFMFPFYLL